MKSPRDSPIPRIEQAQSGATIVRPSDSWSQVRGRIPTPWKEKMEALAYEKGVSFADYLRMTIAEKLKAEGFNLTVSIEGRKQSAD